MSVLTSIRWLWLKNVVAPAELAQARRAEERIERLNAKLDEALEGCEDARLERKAIEADLEKLESGSPQAEEYERLLRGVKARQLRSEKAKEIVQGQIRLLEEYIAMKEEIAMVTLDDSDAVTARIDRLMVRLDQARDKRMRSEAAQEQLQEEKKREEGAKAYEAQYSASTLRDVDGPAPEIEEEAEPVEIEEEKPKERLDEISE